MEHFYFDIGENWFNYQDLYKEAIYKYGSGSHFVEVGSWKGRSSVFMAVEIINSGFDIQFDCVDTWSGSVEHQNLYSIVNNTLYKEFMLNIKPVKKYINPIRTTSVEASSFYDDLSLDFVFIDASHEYEDVKADILAWLPKIKKGGTIAGHDYHIFDGVKKAVDEFFPSSKIILSEEQLIWIHLNN